MRFLVLNQTGSGQVLPYEKGATFRAFFSHREDVKHDFLNKISIITVSLFSFFSFSEESFNKSALEICKGLEQTSRDVFAPPTAHLRLDCLKKIVNQQFDESALEVCKGLKRSSRNALSPYNADLKLICLEQIANQQFDKSALEICKGLEQTSRDAFTPPTATAHLRLDCLKQIANQQFGEDVVEVCKELMQTSQSNTVPPTAHLQVECLVSMAQMLKENEVLHALGYKEGMPHLPPPTSK